MNRRTFLKLAGAGAAATMISVDTAVEYRQGLNSPPTSIQVDDAIGMGSMIRVPRTGEIMVVTGIDDYGMPIVDRGFCGTTPSALEPGESAELVQIGALRRA